MDYCSKCRRHLNGALVCPGCGAYAPDIAPPAAGRISSQPATTDSAPAVDAVRDTSSLDTWHDGPLRGEEDCADWDATPYAASSAVVGDIPTVREGRAARRRQLARWKKNKRRAAVATAVALVGSGLSIATMERHSPDRARAATAPDQQNIGAVEAQTPAYTRPAPTPPTPHQSSNTSEAGSPASGTPRKQPPAAPPRTTPSLARPDAAAPPAPATASAPQSQPQPQDTVASSHDSDHDPTGTAAGRPSAPATAESPDSGTPQTGSAPVSTSPTQVCLLVLCLG
ncbi:SCO2400 family protein [Streptomyces sp. NBC_00663]|uniref:SCO2400 family protein n=1 Tax=Streptomyces sp. NBC_00663 TaxID=2975801 RepID=UPI003FCE91ED